jgi:SOS-response transcriptional repressor LexA
VVRGDSMGREFREGDKIIVDPEVAPQPGDYVVAKVDGEGEATFKKYRPRGADAEGRPVIDLVPLNEDWPVLRIDAARPGRILGTLVEHRRYRRR